MGQRRQWEHGHGRVPNGGNEGQGLRSVEGRGSDSYRGSGSSCE